MDIRGPGGNPVGALSAEQQAVLRSLSLAEVATLNSVKARIDAATDVEGHASVVGVAIF